MPAQCVVLVRKLEQRQCCNCLVNPTTTILWHLILQIKKLWWTGWVLITTLHLMTPHVWIITFYYRFLLNFCHFVELFCMRGLFWALSTLSQPSSSETEALRHVFRNCWEAEDDQPRHWHHSDPERVVGGWFLAWNGNFHFHELFRFQSIQVPNEL